MHGYLSFIPVALGCLTAVSLVAFAVLRLAPWQTPLTVMQHQDRFHAAFLRSLKATAPITIGSSLTSQGGDTETYVFQVAAARQRLVLQLQGPTPVWAGIWYADSDGSPIQGQGQVSGCGANSWMIHVFPKAGPAVIVMSGSRIPVGSMDATPTTGPYALKLRKYIFLYDDIQLKLHPNSC